MNKSVLIFMAILSITQGAAAGFTALAERCLEAGKDLDTSRTYSFHIDSVKNRGILVAIDTDKLTEVYEGSIVVKDKVTRFVSPEVVATFTKATGDAGGTALINSQKRFCDFAQ